MTVRPATPDDADAIARLEAEGRDGSAWTRAAVELMLEQGDDSVVLVAEHGGEVAGFLLGTAIADEGEVMMVRVSPDARRLGLGRALMEAAEQAWRDREVTKAFLEVRVDNAAARALYATLGWAEVGRRRAYYDDGEDALVLRRDLSATPPDPVP